MDGGDVMEVDVYKKRGEHWKRDKKIYKREREREREREKIRRKNIEKRK